MAILIICEDMGSFNNVFPVGKILEEYNYEVVWIPRGMALYTLSKMGVSFEKFLNDKDIFKKYPCPDAIIGGFSGSGMEQKMFLTAVDLGIKCPRIYLPDGWGGWCFMIKWEDCLPEYVCVNDTFDRDLTLRGWANLTEDKIFITGWPAFDIYAKFDFESERRKMVLDWGLEGPTIFFVGTVEYTGATFKNVVDSLVLFDKKLNLIFRCHPNMDKQSSDLQKRLWMEAISKARAFDKIRVIEDNNSSSVLSTLAVADVVMSDISTLLNVAATLGKFNVSVLFPGSGKECFERVYPGLKEPPIVTLKCGDLACDHEDLYEIISDWLDNGNKFFPKQKEIFKMDGKNTIRVVEVIKKLL